MLCSCSVNKFIPDKQYLLDEVDVVSDSKEVKPSLFTSYIRQNPNAKWFNLVKIPMRIYCISGKDSSKWMNRFLQKIGDAPKIYDETIALKSQREIEKAVRNMGYMRAVVRLDTIINKNKLKLSYNIKTDSLYRINHIAYQIDDWMINELIMQDSVYSLLSEGMPFDVVALDNERQRITKLLQNNGYFKFNKDFIVY